MTWDEASRNQNVRKPTLEGKIFLARLAVAEYAYGVPQSDSDGNIASGPTN